MNICLLESRLMRHSSQRASLPTDGANCGDTNLSRPNYDVGLAHGKSLTIIFVESGLERPALGHRALVQAGLWGEPRQGKALGWIFRPFDLVTRGIWLLGSCSRSNGVVPGYPSMGFFCGGRSILSGHSLSSSLSPETGWKSPPSWSHDILFYTSLRSLSFVHV